MWTVEWSVSVLHYNYRSALLETPKGGTGRAPLPVTQPCHRIRIQGYYYTLTLRERDTAREGIENRNVKLKN